MTKKRLPPEIRPAKVAKPDYRKMYEAAIVRGDELQEQAEDLVEQLNEAQDIAVFNMSMHVVAGLLGNPSFDDVDNDPDKMDALLDFGYKISDRLVTRFRKYMVDKREAQEAEKKRRTEEASGDGGAKLN